MNKDDSAHAHVGFGKIDVVQLTETVGRDVVPDGIGPPVQLSRDEVGHEVGTLEEFEARGKRHRINLRMSKNERERKLREQGISSEEFRLAEQEAAKIRDSREKSSHEDESDLHKHMAEANKKKLAGQKKKGLKRFNPFGRQKKR